MEGLSDYQKAQKWLERFDWDNDPEADDNLATICYALQEIEKHKDLEEQGMLLKLPCAVGDTVYVAMQFGGYAEAEVRDYTYFISCGFCVVVTSDKFNKHSIPFSEFGKTIFLACPDGGDVN